MPFSGFANYDPGMFGSIRPTPEGPSPEDIEAGRMKVMFNKHVKLRGHHSRIFNLHVEEEARAYEKLIMEIALGTQANTHTLWGNQKELLLQDHTQQWFRHVEWSEFELIEKATPPVGTEIPDDD